MSACLEGITTHRMQAPKTGNFPAVGGGISQNAVGRKFPRPSPCRCARTDFLTFYEFINMNRVQEIPDTFYLPGHWICGGREMILHPPRKGKNFRDSRLPTTRGVVQGSRVQPRSPDSNVLIRLTNTPSSKVSGIFPPPKSLSNSSSEAPAGTPSYFFTTVSFFICSAVLIASINSGISGGVRPEA